jgi:hypothetical protein
VCPPGEIAFQQLASARAAIVRWTVDQIDFSRRAHVFPKPQSAEQGT